MDSTEKVLLVAAVLAAAVLGVAVALLVRLVRTRRDLRRAGLPTGPRWVFWGAVAYLILPTDLLPDPVYLDDIGVLLLALRSLHAAGGERLSLPARRTGRFGRRGHMNADDYAP
ncbi:YkvA family protein [Streptomyces kebangsaanensis]|uniref:YkvA family protein n=1 Tax=Streptomyces kebangsaanensis TaxID=864058 RepID=A0ABW6KWL9_9ACTN|nr:YkvA family protein [Streptomyces kebangsaanensis]